MKAWGVLDTRNHAIVASFDNQYDAYFESNRLNHLAYRSNNPRYIAMRVQIGARCETFNQEITK